MKRNKMGNLLSIAGDDAEDIKRFIDSFLSQDSESDDPEEKCVDFCKIIAVADPEDEEECLREWGVKQNASNTSVSFVTRMHSMQGNLLLRVDMNMANCMNRAVKIRLFCFMRFGGDTMLL